MNPRELLLLHSYSYPGRDAMVIGNEEMACWLNGYTALWHPAALWQAAKPPRHDVPYDYENPRPGQVYAIPDMPAPILPDQWDERVKEAGAITFYATTDRQATLHNLLQALKNQPDQPAGLDRLIDLPAEQVAPFFGLGLGHLLLASLSEAMEHENLLEHERFWDDVQLAIAALAGLPYTPTAPPPPSQEPASYYPDDYQEYAPAPDPEELRQDPSYPDNVAEGEDVPPNPDLSPEGEGGGLVEGAAPHPDPLPEGGGEEKSQASPEGEGESKAVPEAAPPSPESWTGHLQNAAQRLVSAREVLYPVTIHLLDILVLDEARLAGPWPPSVVHGLGCNLIASGALLEKLAEAYPAQMAELRRLMETDLIEVCGGIYLDREDPLLPVDSQLWNLLKGQEVSEKLLGRPIQVFASKRYALHPQLPLFLSSTGLSRALLISFDESGRGSLSYSNCTVSLPSADGKQVDGFVRQPLAVDSPQTFFNLGHYWFKTTREDQTATLAFLHRHQPPAPWYHDIIELSRLAPLLGQWTTFSQYFNTVVSGEQGTTLNPDECHSDFLTERVEDRRLRTEDRGQKTEDRGQRTEDRGVVSDFPRHVRLRRRLDACCTLAGIYRGLTGNGDTLRPEQTLAELEDRLERSFSQEVPGLGPDLAELEQKIAIALTERLQARAEANRPGYMILNPCSFPRRVALELEGAAAPLPIVDPVKACQLDGSQLRVVVEVPPLGFAWIPRSGPPGTPPPPMRMRLADGTLVGNEFFEAEIDKATGGLRSIHDRRTMLNRLAQRLVFNPGSVMKASSIKVTSAGPALGEIVTEGTLVGEHQQVLARFRQRYRAWLGRPMLEVRIEIFPEQPPAGYPWHAYYGARFAWRDERAALLRGINGTGYVTTHNRPQTPDYLELHFARQGTVIFPGGLPFHQRHEGRMLDIILVPEGEKNTSFDLGIALDREQPMQTAMGMVTPVAVVPTDKGPPHIGSTGWLFHLDAGNLLLSRLHPGGLENLAGTGSDRNLADAVTARLLECAGHSGHAEFRCVRDPRRAVLLNMRGQHLLETTASGDTAYFEISPGDLVQLQMEFS